MKDNKRKSGKNMSCTVAELAVGCAEVILEAQDASVRRKKVEALKVFVHQVAERTGNDLLATAVWLMPTVGRKVPDGWGEGPPT